MIDGFAPQPWPLLCSSDGEDWQLVIGWREDKPRNELHPVVLAKDGPTTLTADSIMYQTPDAAGRAATAAPISSARHAMRSASVNPGVPKRRPMPSDPS